MVSSCGWNRVIGTTGEPLAEAPSDFKNRSCDMMPLALALLPGMPLEGQTEMFFRLPANARLGGWLPCPRQAQI